MHSEKKRDYIVIVCAYLQNWKELSLMKKVNLRVQFVSRAYVQLNDIERGAEPLDEGDVDDDDGVDDDGRDRGGYLEDEEGGQQLAEPVHPGVAAVAAGYVGRIEGAVCKNFDLQKLILQQRKYKMLTNTNDYRT